MKFYYILILALVAAGVLFACNTKKEKATSPRKTSKVATKKKKPAGTTADRTRKKQEELIALLRLDPEETKKFNAITDKYKKLMDDVRAKNKGNREAIKSAMQSLRSQKSEEMKTIMTEKQFQFYLDKTSLVK